MPSYKKKRTHKKKTSCQHQQEAARKNVGTRIASYIKQENEREVKEIEKQEGESNKDDNAINILVTWKIVIDRQVNSQLTQYNCRSTPRIVQNNDVVQQSRILTDRLFPVIIGNTDKIQLQPIRKKVLKN